MDRAAAGRGGGGGDARSAGSPPQSLDESKVYVDDCTLEHSDRLIDLLEERNIPLFLSGHLHVQHFMQHDDIGIYEVVTSSLATPPCQYGVLGYMSDESFSLPHPAGGYGAVGQAPPCDGRESVVL